MTEDRESPFTQPLLDKIAETLPDGVTDAEILALMMSIIAFYQIPPDQAKAMFNVASQIYDQAKGETDE